MKNNKGEVAALLTLGLVLIGSLVTIGISFLTTHNKIASNPKAGGGCQVIGPGQACCFTKHGGTEKLVYGTYDSMCNSGTNLDCSVHGVVSSYQADGPAYPCDGSSPVEGSGCGGPTSCGPGGTGGTGPPGVVDPECLNSASSPKADPDNCTDLGSAISQSLSTKDGKIFVGDKCAGTGMTPNAASQYCAGLTNDNCEPADCKEVNISWPNGDIWKNYVNGRKWYLTEGCNTTALNSNSQELKNHCNPSSGGAGGGGGGGGGQKVTVGADTYYGCGYAIDVTTENTVDIICAGCGTSHCVPNEARTQVYCCDTKQ